MAAIVMLDNIIRDMNLTQVDIADSDACIFRQHVVPTVEEGAFHEQTRCACVHPRAAQNPADYSFWRNPLPWDRAWDPSEIRKEEIRRVCWNAVSIVARYTTQCAALGTTPTGQFWLMDPSNVRVSSRSLPHLTNAPQVPPSLPGRGHRSENSHIPRLQLYLDKGSHLGSLLSQYAPVELFVRPCSATSELRFRNKAGQFRRDSRRGKTH